MPVCHLCKKEIDTAKDDYLASYDDGKFDCHTHYKCFLRGVKDQLKEMIEEIT